ncbi:unnamed protein product [Leptosia nina]|uniref:Uncharacterized protein n=1 Tax=Leptosia nina TaxID=320188 RepID=A0AAV1IT15_9NEOP
MYTQTEELSDIKESSKNLMSGDFERQYKEGMEKGVKGRGCVVFGVSVAALAVWLLVITVVREVQIANLRHEVDQLTANMIGMSANVMSLNQKLTNNRLFNEFKNLEDTCLLKTEPHIQTLMTRRNYQSGRYTGPDKLCDKAVDVTKRVHDL